VRVQQHIFVDDVEHVTKDATHGSDDYEQRDFIPEGSGRGYMDCKAMS
jgi:hypothetical protein